MTRYVVAAVGDIPNGKSKLVVVNRRPVADIVPHVEERDPWVPASELRRIRGEAAADPDLLTDLADIRGDLLDEL